MLFFLLFINGVNGQGSSFSKAVEIHFLFHSMTDMNLSFSVHYILLRYFYECVKKRHSFRKTTLKLI